MNQVNKCILLNNLYNAEVHQWDTTDINITFWKGLKESILEVVVFEVRYQVSRINHEKWSDDLRKTIGKGGDGIEGILGKGTVKESTGMW